MQQEGSLFLKNVFGQSRQSNPQTSTWHENNMGQSTIISTYFSALTTIYKYLNYACLNIHIVLYCSMSKPL